MNPELWKDIPGYGGDYKISSRGQVKSLKGKYELILSPGINPKGYLFVQLCKKGISHNHRIHRLVADAFLSNDLCLSQINHKNGNKKDNTVENLERCTNNYNHRHSIEVLKNKYGSKSIIQINKIGEMVSVWESVSIAGNYSGVKRSNIENALTGINKTAGGYIWKYSIERS